jgi:hypothetical protein
VGNRDSRLGNVRRQPSLVLISTSTSSLHNSKGFSFITLFSYRTVSIKLQSLHRSEITHKIIEGLNVVEALSGHAKVIEKLVTSQCSDKQLEWLYNDILHHRSIFS